MTTMAVELQGMRTAIKHSLVEWANRHPTYKPLWNRVTEDVRKIALDAIDEMDQHKPGYYEVWWATNHNRYIRRPDYSQKQLALLHEVFYAYLSAFSSGRLITSGKYPPEHREDEPGDSDTQSTTPRRKTKIRR